MKTLFVEKSSKLGRSSFHAWVFLSMAVGVLTCCLLVGTQSVHGAGSCTSAQCSDAEIYANNVCFNELGVVYFQCPLPGETDDFFFICGSGYREQDDCTFNHPPS